ncbi:MAG: TlyA family RNA methyltransferase [Erysipelotrichaceae bacterium]
MRLDSYLYEKGLCKSRTMAKDNILNNLVKVNDVIVNKASLDISDSDVVTLINNVHDFASRGGLKLLEALKNFSVDVNDNICLDLGASTGGFCDVLLINGASKVFALDVGTNQLAHHLLNDERIVNLQKTDVRDLPLLNFNDHIDFISIDMSFISIIYAFKAIKESFNYPIRIIGLIKPQFEVGNKHINKHGVVKNDKIVVDKLQEFFYYFVNNNYSIENISKCHTLGKKGNQEYLVYLQSKSNNTMSIEEFLRRITC